LKATRSPSRVFPGLPPHGAGTAIGLLGGSFNPPHEGHRRISKLALRRLGLDQLWWLITPGNPLKDVTSLSPIGERMRAAAAIAAHPRIAVTGVECLYRTRFTADLIAMLKRRAPSVRFVWIMGSDNLGQFHRWDRWREIAAAVPIAVVGRPGTLVAGLSAPAARALASRRIDESDALTLPRRRPPAWVVLTGPRTVASSTAMRARLSRR
jgi:nicotinate-nucleotide adenylyltransferase